MLHQLAIVLGKSGWEVTVNIEFTDNLTMAENRNHNLRFCLERASQIARILVNVIHHDGVATRGGRSADTLVEADARVWGHDAFKWAKNQNRIR